MLADERLAELLAYIREKRAARYTQISKDLHVSQSTVRRDAAMLEQQGYIERIYGGVRLSGATLDKMPLPLRIQSNPDAKDVIAREAVSLLHDGMMVFLFGSSTVMRMVPHMHRLKNLRVVTNSVIICEQLLGMGIETFLTGGKMRLSDHDFAGVHAEQALNAFRFDASFFAPTAITQDGDITVYTDEHIGLFRRMTERSAHVYILCNAAKIGREEVFTVGHVRDVDRVISDQPLPEHWQAIGYRGGRHDADSTETNDEV